MRKSNRGNVDPFIVMDVMENARKAEEKGEEYCSYGSWPTWNPSSNRGTKAAH